MLTIGAVSGLTACSFLAGAVTTVHPSVTAIASVSQPPSVKPTTSKSPTVRPTSTHVPSTTTLTPSPTGLTRPPVRATGQMTLFQNVVSKSFTGTCQHVNGDSQIKLADKKNPFFHTVAVSVMFDAETRAVSTVSAEFGEDNDGITRTMTYQASDRTKGASASASGSGATWTISGKSLIFEDRSVTGELIPFSIKVTCASATW